MTSHSNQNILKLARPQPELTADDVSSVLRFNALKPPGPGFRLNIIIPLQKDIQASPMSLSGRFFKALDNAWFISPWLFLALLLLGYELLLLCAGAILSLVLRRKDWFTDRLIDFGDSGDQSGSISSLK